MAVIEIRAVRIAIVEVDIAQIGASEVSKRIMALRSANPEEAVRMAACPRRAPGRLEVPRTKGMPRMATSEPTALILRGMRKNVVHVA